jgi:hypothetical protein
MAHSDNVVRLFPRSGTAEAVASPPRADDDPGALDPFDKTLIALLFTIRHLHSGGLRLDRAEQEVAESVELLRRWAMSACAPSCRAGSPVADRGERA